jgi:putative salt-induced outer membrane protein
MNAIRRALYTCLMLGSVVFADQITLKNGDRLTGSILKNDGEKLTMKTELAGEVTVPWEAVTAIATSEAVHIELKDGQHVVGALNMDEGRIQVSTAETGSVSASRDSVKFIRSKAEQAAYDAEIDRYRNPRLVDLWGGFLDLAFATTQGNAETSTFTLGGEASRITTRDKISVRYTSLYARSDASGESITTANAKRGGITYNLNLSPRWFTFGSVDLEFDEFQNLDLRFVPAGGLGAHMIRRERTTLDFQLGAAANREFFSTGLRRTSGEVLLGEEFIHQFNDRTSVRQKMVVFPNVTDGGSYRVNFDTSAVAALNRWLSWQFTASNRYLSNPVPGRKKNDILFTTGVRLTFAK